MNYYSNCTKILQDLCKQIGVSNKNQQLQAPPVKSGNNATALNSNSNNSATNETNLLLDTSDFSVNAIGAGLSMNLNLNSKKAKVLFDYEATDPAEISVFANQVLILQFK